MGGNHGFSVLCTSEVAKEHLDVLYHWPHIVWTEKKKKTGEKQANTTSKFHPSGNLGWSGHHGLEPLWCLWAWIACRQINSQFFFKDICRGMLAHLFANWNSTEVGWCNRTTNQITGVINNRMTSAKEITPSDVARDLKRAIHTKHPKNTAELKEFCKMSFWPLCRSDLQLQETFAGGYCCQTRVSQLLNPRVHILFTPCTVHAVCSRKDMKKHHCFCVMRLIRLSVVSTNQHFCRNVW